MAVALVNDFAAIELVRLGGRIEMTFVEPSRSVPPISSTPFWSGISANDRVRGVGIQLDTVRVIVASHISDKFHDRKLHTKTESEEGILFSRA